MKKKYIAPTQRIISFDTLQNIFEGTVQLDPPGQESDDVWTRRFDWNPSGDIANENNEPNDYFY